MEIFDFYCNNCSRVCLILGFFDGIHLGHKAVIESAINYARQNNTKTVLLTFKKSPAETIKGCAEYIYLRDKSYKFIESLGVDYLCEVDFSELVNISAEEYLEKIIELYSPISISTGFNYTFGKGKSGNAALLVDYQGRYGYKYFCMPEIKYENKTISSTNIKNALKIADFEFVNKVLILPFSITSKVIYGQKLGRKLGFPTANMIYPKNIVKIPYGVYHAKAFGKNAMLNWGTKPTVDGRQELLELHILDFDEDLYGKNITFEIINKVREEKKFESIEALKSQIEKDVEECLK